METYSWWRCPRYLEICEKNDRCERDSPWETDFLLLPGPAKHSIIVPDAFDSSSRRLSFNQSNLLSTVHRHINWLLVLGVSVLQLTLRGTPCTQRWCARSSFIRLLKIFILASSVIWHAHASTTQYSHKLISAYQIISAYVHRFPRPAAVKNLSAKHWFHWTTFRILSIVTCKSHITFDPCNGAKMAFKD